jgi:hypothetical protein
MPQAGLQLGAFEHALFHEQTIEQEFAEEGFRPANALHGQRCRCTLVLALKNLRRDAIAKCIPRQGAMPSSAQVKIGWCPQAVLDNRLGEQRVVLVGELSSR